MDDDSTISLRDVKMEEATPAATDPVTAASPLPATVTSINSFTADNDDVRNKKPQNVMPYRSWKRKHLKMRIAFEDKMELNTKLHAEEARGIQTSKRLAVEIDRILDLLLDVNNSAQIPGSKRIDLSLPVSTAESKTLSLDIDQKGGWEKRFDPQLSPPESPVGSLKALLHDVRHVDLAAAKRGMPSMLRDLVAGDDNKLAFVVPAGTNPPPQPPQKNYPESFLAADDVDNYLWEVDHTVAGRALLDGKAPPPMLPTLAPFAYLVDAHTPAGGSTRRGSAGSTGWEEFFNRSISKTDLPTITEASPSMAARDSILRNPTSVFNWLKRNAPKAVFLQEGEAATAAAAAAAADREHSNSAHAHHNGDDYHYYSYGGAGSQNGGTGGGAPTARGRKSAVGSGGSERTASSRGGATRKRPLTAAALRGEHLMADDVESDDLSFEMATPRTMGGPATGRGGKRKRPAQDDDSYRSKAGAASTAGGAGARGTKRKRKSEAGPDAAAGGATTTAAAKKARKSGDVAAAAAAAAAAADVDMVAGNEDVAMGEGAGEAGINGCEEPAVGVSASANARVRPHEEENGADASTAEPDAASTET